MIRASCLLEHDPYITAVWQDLRRAQQVARGHTCIRQMLFWQASYLRGDVEILRKAIALIVAFIKPRHAMADSSNRCFRRNASIQKRIRIIYPAYTVIFPVEA